MAFVDQHDTESIHRCVVGASVLQEQELQEVGTKAHDSNGRSKSFATYGYSSPWPLNWLHSILSLSEYVAGVTRFLPGVGVGSR